MNNITQILSDEHQYILKVISADENNRNNRWAWA